MLTSTAVCYGRFLGTDDHIVLAAPLRILFSWPVRLLVCLGVDVHIAPAVLFVGLVITPPNLVEFVWDAIDAHIALGR